MQKIGHSGKARGDMRKLTLTVAVLLAALLSACGPAAAPEGPDPTATAPPPASGGNLLEGTEWVLTSLGASPLLDGTHITLKFAEGKLGGFAGCNSYGGAQDSGGQIATAEGTLTVSEMAMTAMACPSPEGVMEQEQAYVEALRAASTYHLDGDRLELRDAGGATILTFARQEALGGDIRELVGTSWRLISMDGTAPMEGSDITLAFHDEHRLGGHAGCQDYVVVYDAGGDGLELYYTAMMGPSCSDEALQEQEGTYTTILGWADRFRLGDGRLEILTVRGEELLFEPLPGEAQSELEGHTWYLLAFIETNLVEGMPLPLPTDVLAGTEITLTFEGGMAQGSAGCNTYLAAYAVGDSSVGFEDLTFTERACLTPEGVLEQEDRFLGLLRDVRIYHVHGDQLWLETGDGRGLVFWGKVPR